jgi:4-amino-4-deoxy-L-arabinose transferase-like glycosyltransferase
VIARAARFVGPTGWASAGLAVVCALVWALVVPPFQVPDETGHLGYAQYLAETGKVPRPVPGEPYSSEQRAAMEASQFGSVFGNRDGKPPWSAGEGAQLRAALEQDLPRDDGGAFSSSTNNPPLYYLLQAPVYHAAGGDLLDRLHAMRLLSVVLAGVTTLGVFLFVRELLPGSRALAAVGALAVAAQPTFAFVSSGVNNDALLFAAAAWLFFCVARAFRVGLSPGLGLGIGAAVAVGVLGKTTFAGLLPGAALGLLVVALRDRSRRRCGLVALAAGAAVALVALVAYLVALQTAWDRPLFAGVVAQSREGTGGAPAGFNVPEFLGYLWQFYLPRLPFMADQFPLYHPLWETWFRGFVGRFGWLDYDLPRWVYSLALAVYLALLALVGVALARHAATVRRRGVELATYLLMAAGLLLVIALPGYTYREQTGFVFEQARYLLPLLAPYGALVALAARGAGRLAPAVGLLVVSLALAHGLGAQLVTLARYYA